MAPHDSITSGFVCLFVCLFVFGGDKLQTPEEKFFSNVYFLKFNLPPKRRDTRLEFCLMVFQCVVFNDISPQAPVHFLVVPKKPLVRLADVDEGDEKVKVCLLFLLSLLKLCLFY